MVNDNYILQKHLERYHLSIFQKIMSIPGEEVKEWMEKPDFLFIKGTYRIGIEHVELKDNALRANSSVNIREQPEAEFWGFRRGMVKKAESLYNSKKLPCLDVLVWFNKYHDNIPKGGDEFIEAMVTAIEQNIDTIIKVQGKSKIPFKGYPVTIRAERSSKSRWIINEARHLKNNLQRDLQEITQKKSKNIERYLQNCDECWLLIVADRTKADQKYVLSDDIEDSIFLSRFGRTFFLEIAHEFLRELRTKNSE